MNRQSFLLFTYAPGSAAAKAAGSGGGGLEGRQGQGVSSLAGARARTDLDDLFEEFPFLAAAAAASASGEERAHIRLDPRTRHLAAVAACAAAGNRHRLRIHAGRALDDGIRQDELKEIVYLTADHAGSSRAIEAARALSELFAERWEASRPIS